MPLPGGSRSWIIIGVVFNAICLAISITLLRSNPKYDYIGQHFPVNLPVSPGTIDVTFSDETRYPFSKNVSLDMWLTEFPKGAGYVQLGSDYRAFYMAMWHELHCMQVIQLLLEDPEDTSFGGEPHLQHCLNYLRQYILCNADDTLEPGDYHNEDLVFTRECKDWNPLFEFNNRNNEQFVEEERRRAKKMNK